MKKRNILIGVTGSVAAIKVDEFVKRLKEIVISNKIEIEIKIVATDSAKNFLNDSILDLLVKCQDEFSSWVNIGDDILHINLRQWADLYIILPLTANTLAKLSNGLCDNLLTNIARAWDFKKPIIVCPAMNTFMWEHPITLMQINTLISFGYKVVFPIEKKLACGEYGMGGMQEVEKIIEKILLEINLPKKILASE
ncbi:uncharacterized protein ELE39_003498 [Cryptosporidium sp. chipmunk genotype I]|uniref:uncharacterized protein n=1 Tax=Cryptosporidium sp. chipmunk genotype I TaxID=1280935 RepID=UPI00351A0FD4|nr:hypothetical protein ELE39_003498 [Cryptosporidium sp. chipmunk genotype I]